MTETLPPASPARVQLPGRLGNPAMTLRDDPRADPRVVAALARHGLDVPPPPPPVALDAPLADLLAIAGAAEAAFDQVFAEIFAGVTPVPGVSTETRAIPGPDGNEITLYVHRPTGAAGPLPGIVHLHGGGMVMLTAADGCYVRWRESLAAAGLVVVGVEFRNGGGKLGNHPFPAGLNDCATALRWTLDHADELGIGKVLVSGESGGGNLTLATTLLAHRQGWADRIAGVYALCPFISGRWAERPAELTSLHENDGYFLAAELMGLLARVYDPEGAHAHDPTCWPLAAGPADLSGLPPHVISVNELDPLRDEGLLYVRKLYAAGVSAVGRVVVGTSHGADVILATEIPEVYAATIRDIKGFADSV